MKRNRRLTSVCARFTFNRSYLVDIFDYVIETFVNYEVSISSNLNLEDPKLSVARVNCEGERMRYFPSIGAYSSSLKITIDFKEMRVTYSRVPSLPHLLMEIGKPT